MNVEELSGQRQAMLGLENETVEITLMREQLYMWKLPLCADFSHFKIAFLAWSQEDLLHRKLQTEGSKFLPYVFKNGGNDELF